MYRLKFAVRCFVGIQFAMFVSWALRSTFRSPTVAAVVTVWTMMIVYLDLRTVLEFWETVDWSYFWACVKKLFWKG